MKTLTMTHHQTLNDHLRRVIQIHFDPDSGSRFWLERQQKLGINAIEQIRTINDLGLLGPMAVEELQNRPMEDFIPASHQRHTCELIIAETGGTLGRPKFAIHWRREFQRAFIEPFVLAARRFEFPYGKNWLYIGPTGPHIIGIAARSCARVMNSADPFMVDFDPRWARTLAPGSFAQKRYLQHVEAQALNVIKTQNIGVLFATPAVLDSLARQIDTGQREPIAGLHLGGMSVSPSFRKTLAEQFPNAVILSGYGNTLFGMAPELHYSEKNDIDYFPLGTRLIYSVVDYNVPDEQDRIGAMLDYGQRGQVMVHRLDEMQLIVNMLERDQAIRVAVPPCCRADGFILDGLRDPQPIVQSSQKPILGLY